MTSTDPSSSPPSRRPQGLLQEVYAFLVSPKLAIGLLVVVLGCCLAGVTLVRGAEAGALIFATLWFNALLVLLAISSATAFFTRIWRRKLTLVSAGMILFHLSFAALLGGVVYDSLFSFRGVMRLTEGETLPNGQRESYDEVAQGRFFDPARLRGETTLVRMHTNYKVDGDNKRAAYELLVSDGASRTQRIIYITEYLDFEGLRYFCLKEGYSVLVVLSARGGPELFGAHVPLQSIRQEDGKFLYAVGSATEATSFAIPPPPDHPRADLRLTYFPSAEGRTGQVRLVVRPFGPTGQPLAEKQGLVQVGGLLEAGDLVVSPREIRYWVGVEVRYDPGLVIILSSLCLGLVGMVITFAGRLRQGGARKRAA
jgi:hypothetical protein